MDPTDVSDSDLSGSDLSGSDAVNRDAQRSHDVATDVQDAETMESPVVDPLLFLEQERDEYKDKLLRAAADLENARKRGQKDAQDALKRGREDMLREVLPVMDNLERASDAASHASDVQAVAEGVQMVLAQFKELGDRLGLTRIETVGKAFDPALHQALQQLETDEYPPNTVVTEVQAGYQMNGRLLRAAMVIVAKAPALGSEEATDTAEVTETTESS